MIAPLTFGRLHERGTALGRWIDAGGDVDRLVALDRATRHAERTDFPGRPAEEPEVRWSTPDRTRREP